MALGILIIRSLYTPHILSTGIRPLWGAHDYQSLHLTRSEQKWICAASWLQSQANRHVLLCQNESSSSCPRMVLGSGKNPERAFGLGLLVQAIERRVKLSGPQYEVGLRTALLDRTYQTRLSHDVMEPAQNMQLQGELL